MNRKTRYHILLVTLLILALTTISCSVLGDKKEGQATRPPVGAETRVPAGEKETPPTQAVPSAGGTFADPQESLDSYRMRARFKGNSMGAMDDEMTTEVEWVRDPEARHTIIRDASGKVVVEQITIGKDTWTSMDGHTWMHVSQPGPEESATGPNNLAVEDVLQGITSNMKKIGKDEVDGVNCTRYSVDTDFSIPAPIPEDASAEEAKLMPKELTGHITGEVCVADERGLPKIIIRSQTTQEVTLKFASGQERKMVYDENHELYDINEPITIEPPQGQVQEMPAIPTRPANSTPPASDEQAGESVVYVELNELDSYRMEWTMTAGTGDNETLARYKVEWTKDPPATHLTVDMGRDMPAIEYILVNDTVWMNAGSGWIQVAEEDLKDATSQMGDVIGPDDDMQFVGRETVNGVRCRHYTKEASFQDTSSKLDVWIADQGDLPPVVVRGILRMEGGVTRVIESNVTDINTPITIKPPK